MDKRKRVVSYTPNQPKFKCGGSHALPGGRAKDLRDNEGNFGGLSLEDFIEPSVNDWKGNGNKNGYPLASQNGTPVKSPTDAGAINIPVCDFLGNKDAPGVKCPKLGERLAMNEDKCHVFI